MQYSIWQLLRFTALAAVVFWFVRQFGITATLLAAGILANVFIVSWLDLRGLFSGGLCGAVVQLGVVFLLVVGGAINNWMLAGVLYVIPGAYLGSILAGWRQASDLAGIDAPMGVNQRGRRSGG